MGDATDPADRRQHERKDVLFSASIHFGGRTVAGQVLDISAGGARVEVERPMESKTTVTLAIDRFGDYEGEIAWAKGRTVGVRFSEDPEVMAEVAYAMAVYGPI